MNLQEVIQVIASNKFTLSSEEAMKIEMASLLFRKAIPFKKEYQLDSKNRLDFYIMECAFEVKIKGHAKSIYKQCERYAAFDQVKGIVLVTAKAMGFPPTINGKDCYVINLGRAWL